MKSLILTALGASLLFTGTGYAAPLFVNGSFDSASSLFADVGTDEVYGAAFNEPTGALTFGGFTFAGQQSEISPSDFGASYGSFLGQTTTGNAAFDTLLDHGDYPYGGGVPLTFNLDGLTVGNTYQVLLFTADDRSGSAFRSLTLSDGATTAVSGANQQVGFSDGTGTVVSGTGTSTIYQTEGGFVEETFVATGADITPGAASHQITVSSPDYIELSGLLVVNATATTPEPSTYALLGLGALALLIRGRRAFKA